MKKRIRNILLQWINLYFGSKSLVQRTVFSTSFTIVSFPFGRTLNNEDIVMNGYTVFHALSIYFAGTSLGKDT